MNVPDPGENRHAELAFQAWAQAPAMIATYQEYAALPAAGPDGARVAASKLSRLADQLGDAGLVSEATQAREAATAITPK